MNRAIVTLFRILGITFIVVGVIITIVSMTQFDVLTYRLNSGMMFGIAFPFVGIVLIIIATVMSTLVSNKTQASENNSEQEIAKLVKDSLKSEQDKDSAIKVCNYCGSKVDANKKSCPSCGAKIK